MDPVVVPPTTITRLPTASFKHQYANIYFVRLRLLKPCVEKEATKKWKDVPGSPKLIPRVLDVIKGQLCLIIGTVYMDMPLKPNVLEDIGRDHTIPAPPPPEKIHSEDDRVMLEDESGRIRLIGKILEDTTLVTGVIVGVLGAETSNGDFEAIDLCFPGMAPQVSQDDRMDTDDISGASTDSDSNTGNEYVAFISGLDIGSSPMSEAQTQVLVDYLAGACGDFNGQCTSSQISRLVVLGNSLAPLGQTGGVVNEEKEREDKKSRRHGNDVSFSPHPIQNLSAHLHDLSQSVAIHILPGESDPSGTILPQQALPRAMFGQASSFASFSCETNPTYIRLSSGAQGGDDNVDLTIPESSGIIPIRTILATSGQPLNDMCKYVPTAASTRLNLAEATLKWQTPDIYAIGCQPRFATRLVKDGKLRSRVVLVPSFAQTGIVVLVGLKSLDVRIVRLTEDICSG
ncbi:DNA polymerase alpha/epsilon subunit B-domain-containing protein [Russula aff. rugulosa BPL654]|nr:DNA polymerase alpha/epsilon subunit B-domain-containing protein [Russula aff. rugulosa BPL654]